MNIGMGWVAFWTFAGKVAICATVIWVGSDALDAARTIWSAP